MKRIPIVVLLAVVFFLVFVWGWWFRGGAETVALHSRELATRVLAEHLVKSGTGKRALVVSNPFKQQKGTARDIVAMENAGIRGLEKGLGGKVPYKVVFPELKREAINDPRSVYIDAETATPLSFLVTEEAFDELLESHSDVDLIISLIGLPADLGQVRCWHTNGPPRFALLLPDLRMIGNSEAVRQAFGSGKLVAMVLPKPNAPAADVPLGGDTAAAFEKRYLLVTAGNIEQMIRTYPRLFPGG
jgi:hypothetical protein